MADLSSGGRSARPNVIAAARCRGDPSKGNNDPRRRSHGAAKRACNLGGATAATAVWHRQFENTQTGARRPHLHFDIPAVGHLAHVEAFEAVAADGAIGAHIGVAHAV